MDRLAMDKLNRPEQALVQTAVRQLADATGLPIAVDHEVHLAGGGIVDALVAVGAQGERHIFAAGAKRTATPATINIALQRLATMAPRSQAPIHHYLCQSQASPGTEGKRHRLHRYRGQCLHPGGHVYVYIRGNRPEEPAGTPRQATRAFQATGLRVLFGFLHNPALLNANYRDIARATGVAHGTVGWVLTDLREAGYLIEIKKERRLVRVRQLLGRWIEAYHERLKPKLWLGRYEAPTNHWWQTVELGPYAAVWEARSLPQNSPMAI